MLTSKTAKTFYDPRVGGYGVLPDDVVEISFERAKQLKDEESRGKVIVWGEDGIPFLQERSAPTAAEMLVLFRADIQRFMDAAAVAAGYDDMKTAVTYAEEPAVPKFQAEGQAFRAWRSLVLAYGYEQITAIESGARDMPTTEQLISELPALVLPQ